MSHVPEPIRSATSRIKRQILRLYDNSEPREFEIYSLDSAFGNFTERHAIQGVSGVDATSFLKMVKSTFVGKLREKAQHKISDSTCLSDGKTKSVRKENRRLKRHILVIIRQQNSLMTMLTRCTMTRLRKYWRVWQNIRKRAVVGGLKEFWS